jgi:hypothetical protein
VRGTRELDSLETVVICTVGGGCEGCGRDQRNDVLELHYCKLKERMCLNRRCGGGLSSEWPTPSLYIMPLRHLLIGRDFLMASLDSSLGFTVLDVARGSRECRRKPTKDCTGGIGRHVRMGEQFRLSSWRGVQILSGALRHGDYFGF